MARRGFVLGAAAAALAVPTRSVAMVGIYADAELIRILEGLVAVEQGSGTRTLHVLVSPGCDHSAAMWDTVQARLGAARYRWIPFSGRAETDRAVVARLIDDGTPEAMRACLSGARNAAPASPFAADLAALQDDVVQSRVARLAWDATARPLAAPSLAYSTREGPVLARGSLTVDLLDGVLAKAT